jgi:hypothetical protein
MAGPDLVSKVDNSSIGDVSINENPYRVESCLKRYLICSMFAFSDSSKSFMPLGNSMSIVSNSWDLDISVGYNLK